VKTANHHDSHDLVSTLQDAVRDLSINKHMHATVEHAEGLGPSHCYYLRSVRPKLDVDHTFECQLMGHVLVQSPDWHTMYKQEGFGNGKVSKTGALHKALADVYAAQNSVVNLHMWVCLCRFFRPFWMGCGGCCYCC
jgi:hypothetical protein